MASAKVDTNSRQECGFPEKWPEEGQGINGRSIDGWWTEDLRKQSKRRDLTIDG